MTFRSRIAVSNSYGPARSHRAFARAGRRMLSAALAALIALATPLGMLPSTAVAAPSNAAPADSTVSSVVAARVTTAHLKAVTFIDANVGFAAGSGSTILKTTDGGLTWRVVNGGGSLDFRGISFYNASRGVATTLQGVVYETDNGGENWMLANPDLGGDFFISEQIHDIEYVTETDAVAIGGAQGTAPMVWRSSGGGTGWGALGFEAATYWPPDTLPSDPLPPYPLTGNGVFYAVDFPTAGRGWAVGLDNYDQSLILPPEEDPPFSGDPLYPQPTRPRSIIFDYDSTRGGDGWQLQQISGSGRLWDVSFSGTSNGAAVGDSGKAVYTTNGGSTWTVGPSTGAALYGVALSTGGLGWAVGGGGVIRKTTNNGATWTASVTPAGIAGTALQSVAALGGTKAVAVGDAGAIVLTVDGDTWMEPTEPPQVTGVSSASHPTDTWVADATVDWSWTATPVGAIDGYSFAFDQNAATVPPATVSTTDPFATGTATSSGTWYAHVRARDAVGRWSTTVHAAAKVDITVPAATDDAQATYPGEASIVLGATDAHSGVASISYRIDGGGWTLVPGAAATPSTSTLGDHTLEYFATDDVGNDSDIVLVDFTVTDATAPTVSSDVHPTYTANAIVTITANDETALDEIAYLLDEDAPVTVAATGLSDTASASTSELGDHTLTFWAIDAAGNESAQETVEFTVLPEIPDDTVPPQVTTNAVSTYVNSASITVNATDESGVASVSWRLDGAPSWTHVAGSSAVVSTSLLGAHTLEYYATDMAGNPSDPAEVGFTVTDGTAPAVGSNVQAFYNDSASITLTATDNSALASISYRLDTGGTVTTPASGTSDSIPVTTSVLGAHTLEFWATDAAGNPSGHSTVNFTVNDATDPVAQSDAVATYAGFASIHITATDAGSGVASVSYRLGATGGYTTVTGSSASATTSALGTQTLYFYATDTEGNTSTPQTATFSVTSAPAVAHDDTYSATEDIALTRAASTGLLANDTGADPGETLSVAEWSQPANGTVSVSANGSFTYIPDAQYNGTDSFTYRVTDGRAPSAPATVRLSVAATNDAPSFVAGPAVSVDQDSGAYAGSWASAIAAGPANESAQALMFTALPDRPELFSAGPAISADGRLTFTPAPGATGTAVVHVTLTDDATAGGAALSANRTLTITITPASDGGPDLPPGLVRVAGADRFATAVEASKRAYPDGADIVVIATGANWPDALGGSALAGAAQGPLLLTQPTALPASVAEEIARLGATRAYILGGTGAVSAAVEADLAAKLGGSSAVTRLAGADRYGTARAVADEAIALAGDSYDGGAIVATGGNYPDALAGSPLAAAKSWPILLAHPTSGAVYVPAAVSRVAILGGTGAVSSAVQSTLSSQLGAPNVTRLGGLNRYATAALVAGYGTGQGLAWDGVGVATGENFPDALSAGAMLGSYGTVMLLTQSSALSPDAAAALSAHAGEIETAFVIGGTGAVSSAVADSVRAAAGL